MAAGSITIEYAPRRVFLPFHNRTERFAVGVAHRRCGKTVACINDKIRRAILSPKPMYRAGYCAPYLKQGKDIAWEYLKHYSRPVWGGDPNESELYVTLLGGQRIRIYGADNADSMRGGYFDDVTLDEYADMAPSIWGSIIRPMLADRQGSANFIGTPKGRNAFFDIYRSAKDDPEWFTFMLRASETNLLAPEELSAARRQMTPEQFDQEFECSFSAAILGAFFGKDIAKAEAEGRLPATLKKVDGPIHCAWDFGNGANMAIWAFQVTPKGPIVHDFIQISGMYFEDYLKEVTTRGYNGFDYVPHDAKVPSFETGRTRIETMLAFERKPVLIADHKVDDGINAGRLTLATATFNATACAGGIEALRQYRQEWDEKARVFKTTPKHDWASHPADAWRYLSMAWKQHIEPTAPPAPPEIKGLNEITMDEYAEFDDDRHQPGVRDRL